MLGLNPSMRFYLCEGPVDMRKGIFTLAELVRKIMGKEPSAGDIFIFLSKDRRNIKILHHDTGGIRALLEEAGQRPFPPTCFLQGQSSL